MTQALSGATRLHYIVGDPIAQVKSPAGVTASLQALGRNAVVIPAHVAPADLADYARGMGRARNVDGLIITVPHKFAACDLCATTSERARFLSTVHNVLYSALDSRRLPFLIHSAYLGRWAPFIARRNVLHAERIQIITRRRKSDRPRDRWRAGFEFIWEIVIGRFFNRLVAAAGRYGEDPEFPAGPRQDPRNGVVMAGVAVENDGDLFVFGHKALLI